MPALITTRRSLVLVAAAAVLLTPGVASAKRDGYTSETTSPVGGDAHDGVLTARAGGMRFDYTKSPHAAGTKPLTPPADWSPPACWYAPKWTPRQAAATRLGGTVDFSPNHDPETARANREKYLVKAHNFHLDKQGKGYWWGVFTNPARIDDPAASDCTEPPFWVEKRDQPPAGATHAVKPTVLAEIAYAQIRIPQAKATLQPTAGRQKVNLPTWISLDRTRIHPVSVRASVPALGMESTTRAEPVSVHIDPGTPDAQLYPADGDCKLINRKRPKNASSAPPCGVRYLRATAPGTPYRLVATTTWKITWTGTGHPHPQPLPSGSFGTPQHVVVREVQTIVR